MRGDEGVLSNSIAFMTHPQEGKEIYYKFLLRKKREGKEKEKKKKKRKTYAFGGSNSEEQPSLENKQQQELTAAFSVNVHLLEPGVWGLAEAGQTRDFWAPNLQVGSPHFFFQSKVVLGINPRSLGDVKHGGW